MDFQEFPKIPRYSRDCIITEKIDGTNGQILIIPLESVPLEIRRTTNMDGSICEKDMIIRFGSRNRWLTLANDNFGFCKWGFENYEEILKLGPGRHYGEWWGQGIQRGYGLKEKRFSLFNVIRWDAEMFARFKLEPWKERKNNNTPEPVYVEPPACCSVVPVLFTGPFTSNNIEWTLQDLADKGSLAVPGYMNPEGVVIFHTAGNLLFKKTLKNDEKGKGE